MNYLPENDGKDHINIYSKGNTELGQLLSNFADTPFICPDGAFRSIEAYWYWLLSGDDSLKNLHGYEAKRLGRESIGVAIRYSVDSAEFKKKILVAIFNKIRQTDGLIELLANSELPFDHYYVFNGDRHDAGYEWLVEAFENFRKWAKGEYHPEGKEKKADRYILYGGDVVLLFDDEEHRYYLEETGEHVISTTDVTSIIHKPGLTYWAAKEAVNYLRDNVDPSLYYTDKEWESVLKTAQRAHTAVLREAGDKGHLAHAWIEEYVKGRIAALSGADFEQPEVPDDEEVESSIIAFLKWWKANNVIPISSEKKVYSKTYGYSGTFDFLAYVNGRKSLIDFKSGNRIYPDHYLQLAGYVFAYEEEQRYVNGIDFEPIEQGIIIRVPKDGGTFEDKPIVLLDDHFEAFEAALTLMLWQQRKGRFDKARMKAAERKGIRPALIHSDDQASYDKEIDLMAEYVHLEIAGLNVWQQMSIQDTYVPRKVSKQKLADKYGVSVGSITKILETNLSEIRDLLNGPRAKTAAELMEGS